MQKLFSHCVHWGFSSFFVCCLQIIWKRLRFSSLGMWRVVWLSWGRTKAVWSGLGCRCTPAARPRGQQCSSGQWRLPGRAAILHRKTVTCLSNLSSMWLISLLKDYFFLPCPAVLVLWWCVEQCTNPPRMRKWFPACFCSPILITSAAPFTLLTRQMFSWVAF